MPRQSPAKFGGYPCEPPGFTYRASPYGGSASLKEMLVWLSNVLPEDKLSRPINAVELNAFYKSEK